MSYFSIVYLVMGVAFLASALLDIRKLVQSRYMPLLFSIVGDAVIGAALIALALDQLTTDHFFLLIFPAGLSLMLFRHKYRGEAHRRANEAR